MMHRRIATALTLGCLLALPMTATAQITHNSVTVSWTTPGDDSLSGTASQFDLRYSTSPITGANFAAASRYTGTPTPAAPGTRQSATVTGLTPNTTYFFAIKTGDEIPNWSGVSNVISRTTLLAPDLTRPAPLAISVTAINDSTATLGWNASGDDSLTGTASTYDVRYSRSPITLANWANASQASNEPTPGASGTPQTFVVHGLSRQVTYYFAARVSDDAGNLSGMSNVPSATTPDTTPPAAILDLSSSFVWFGWRSRSADRPRAVSPVVL